MAYPVARNKVQLRRRDVSFGRLAALADRRLRCVTALYAFG
jgi:hypothetical protein